MLKAGIIGLGVGEAHIQGYEAHPNCEVVGICDFSPEKLAEVGSRYPHIPTYENAESILTNPAIDVVTIASYDNFHYEQILLALANNKHIFVEKPICLFEEEAKHIFAELKKRPHLKISSNLILRKSERFIELKTRIDSGDFGDLFFLKGAYNYGRIHKIIEGWRGKLDFYSIVHGGGVHIIDLLLWLSNDKIVEVSAFGNRKITKNSSFTNFDMVASILKFETGIVGEMNANFGCVHPHFHQLEIYGSKATFINEQKEAKWYENRKQPTLSMVDTAYPGVHKGDLLVDFIEAILNDRNPKISKEEVFNAMCVCFAIEKAAHSGKNVQVNYFHQKHSYANS